MIDASRLLSFGVFVAVAIVSGFVNRTDVSTLSFILLISIYAPFVFRLEFEPEDYLSLLKLYQGLALACVACGILQFAVQFVLGAEAMFPFDLVFPDSCFSSRVSICAFRSLRERRF